MESEDSVEDSVVGVTNHNEILRAQMKDHWLCHWSSGTVEVAILHRLEFHPRRDAAP